MGRTREQQIACVSGLSTHKLELILEKRTLHGNWTRPIGCELCNGFVSTDLQNLVLHVLNLTPNSAIPLVRVEGKEVDRVLGSTQERDENMCGVAVSDDGYGRLLAHVCNCSGIRMYVKISFVGALIGTSRVDRSEQ